MGCMMWLANSYLFIHFYNFFHSPFPVPPLHVPKKSLCFCLLAFLKISLIYIPVFLNTTIRLGSKRFFYIAFLLDFWTPPFVQVTRDFSTRVRYNIARFHFLGWNLHDHLNLFPVVMQQFILCYFKEFSSFRSCNKFRFLGVFFVGIVIGLCGSCFLKWFSHCLSFFKILVW